MRILLIDEQAEARDAVVGLLHAAFGRLELTVVDSAAALSQALRRDGLDLVLTEHALSWTDGLSILREVRRRLPGTPVIMVTGSGSETLAVDGLKAGLTDYVPKHALDRLPAAVRAAVRGLDPDRVALVSAGSTPDGAGEIAGAVTVVQEIADRKRARAALRTTLERIGDGFFAVDAGWRFVYVNARAEQWLSIQSSKALGKSFWDVFPLTLGTPLEERYRLAAAGEAQDFESYYEPWDRWFHNRCFPREGGGMVVYFQDITERKASERALQESEERYRAVFENAPLGIFRSTPEGRYLDVNPALATFLGYDSPEEVMREVHDIGEQIYARPGERGEVVTQQMDTGGVTHHLNTYRRKDGSEFLANLYLKTIRDASGTPLYLEGIVEDLTERRQVEAERERLLSDLRRRTAALERANERLEELAAEREEQAAKLTAQNEELVRAESKLQGERQLLQTLFDTVPVMFAIYDPEIETIALSQYFHEVTGWTPEDVAQSNAMDLVYPDPEYRAEVMAYMQSLAPGFRDMHMVAKDGSILVSSWANVALPDGRRVGIGLDITARKQEEERQAFRIALGERLRGLRDPADIVSAAARMLGEHLGVNRVGHAEVDETGEMLEMHDWTDGTVVSLEGRHRIRDWGPELAAACECGGVWQVDDVAADPRPGVSTYAAAYEAQDIRSAVCVPLIRGGRWVALAFMTDNRPHAWTKTEIELIQDVADHTWEAVERGRAERALQSYIEELEALNETNRLLLREVNHRVKNNLTAILGLIMSEQRRLRAPAGCEGEGDDVAPQDTRARYEAGLQSLAERVRSLATAHSLLSAGGWRPLSVGELAGEVIRASLPTANAAEAGPVEIRVNGPEIYITPEQAHHLALVVGELTTNTIKYGRSPDGIRIEVDVSVVEGNVRLVYHNRGPAYPDAILEGRRRSVGLGLVDIIIRHSLRGTWRMRNEGGALTELRFPVSPELNRQEPVPQPG